MTRPGPNVTSDADTQPGSDSLFPTGFSGGGALVRSGSVGTGEIADGSVASADLNLSSVATALAARSEFNATYASQATLDTARWVLSKPSVMATPPTFTAGVANAASAIASSVLVKSTENGAFTYLGGTAPRGTTFPGYNGLFLGLYPQVTSGGTVAVEFVLDTVDATGRFEIYSIGKGDKIRVCVLNSAGRWEYATLAANFTHPSDGNGYRDLVTLGAAGTYNIRLEYSGSPLFWGIQVGPTDTVIARQHTPRRYIVAGDSFSEPTITDTGTSLFPDGWVTVLSHMTGLDIWCAGSGGTGYLKTNGARPKLRDRLANDILAQNPDGIIWAMGINDYPDFTAAQIGAEALLCFQQAKAANPKIDQIVLSPFYPKTLTSGAVGNILAVRDAIKASALAVGAKFLDVLSLPTYDYLGTWTSTLTSGPSAGATTCSVASLPAYVLGQLGVGGLDSWYVQVGTGTTAEVRAVTSVAGSGPYTLTVAALTNAHTAGETVQLAGPSYMTGTGRQLATTGVGNADRYTGSDTTHPTVAGHAHIARTVAWLWARANRLAR